MIVIFKNEYNLICSIILKVYIKEVKPKKDYILSRCFPKLHAVIGGTFSEAGDSRV